MGSARGSVHWGYYYATALDIEVDHSDNGDLLYGIIYCR
jgi:hypothetical protein